MYCDEVPVEEEVQSTTQKPGLGEMTSVALAGRTAALEVVDVVAPCTGEQGVFLSVSARGSPTNWSHDDGAVFFRHPDDNLHPANHWSTAPSCPGIKFIENIVHTTSSAGTSTAAAIKELPLRQRASGHGGSAAMKLLMFFVLPQLGDLPEFLFFSLSFLLFA
ncbi:hypothetical protein HPB47_009425 [Ixodes persulcatus]|uniref:Uncharacterized protein n=1 Tax=Ixodes persulcatus TaxID=34615 RepID=A0AC60P282_IXOPE|nr:hypothetical protein HPB47_009425 [Ixodes persulcatus]